MHISSKDSTFRLSRPFGMERKGAAVSAFVRVDRLPIIERGEIRHPSRSSCWILSPAQVDITEGAEPVA